MANNNANKIEFMNDINKKLKDYENIYIQASLGDYILRLLCSNPTINSLEMKLHSLFYSHTQDFICWLLDLLETKFNLHLDQPAEITNFFNIPKESDLNGEVNKFLDFLDDCNETELERDSLDEEELLRKEDEEPLKTLHNARNLSNSISPEKTLESDDHIGEFSNGSTAFIDENAEEQTNLSKILFDEPYYSYLPNNSPPRALSPPGDIQICLKRKKSPSLTDDPESPLLLSDDLPIINIQPVKKYRFSQGEDAIDISDLSSDSPHDTIHKIDKCQHWPFCKFGNNCNFSHPKICKNLPNCSFGDRCWFTHPKSNFQPQKCKYFPGCNRKNCLFEHPKACQYGLNCPEKTECRLYHPGDIYF